MDIAKDSKVTYYSGEDINKAAEMAKNADAVIMVVGYDNDDEGEFLTNEDSSVFERRIGGDRRNLGLHQNEVDLINAVGKVNKNNAVVLIGGNMILVDNFEANASSILMAYYPGMEGGTVIAETLFGDNNPEVNCRLYLLRMLRIYLRLTGTLMKLSMITIMDMLGSRKTMLLHMHHMASV